MPPTTNPPQTAPPDADDANKPSVFITYAHEDRAFVFALRDRLAAEGIDVRGDWQLQTGTDFKSRLRSFILQSDSLVFVISPDSIRSGPSLEELALAVAEKKRVLPVWRRDHGDDDLLDPALRSPHWTLLTDDDDFDEGVRGLVNAVKTDMELADIHSRLLVNADDWRAGNKNRSYLLRKDNLKEAEAWLARTSAQPDKLPQPTPLQFEYIFASQRARSRGARIAVLIASSVALVLAASTLFAVSRANAAVRSSYEAERTAVEAG